MKNGENYSRRRFVKNIAFASMLVPFLQFCKDETVKLLIRLSGTKSVLGHRLWIKDFPKPTAKVHIPYLIVGGGISGLSAARAFSQQGIFDFLILELENHLGGNASNGENHYSKFPLGAHYLPLPNFHDKELLRFLEEEKIILDYDAKGFPVFDETQLTFSPQERLFYKNSWQESLVPKSGNSKAEDRDFTTFFAKMERFKNTKGADGRYLFDIPLSLSSEDTSTRELDSISMKKWLEQNGFSSEVLFGYVNYCCRDDFGLGIEFVSAWAGIHYFASRKHDSTSDKRDSVLTWPEGNARLAQHLKKYTEGKSIQNNLAFEVKIQGDKVSILVFDDVKKKTTEIIADKVIMATPQFVNQYLIPNRKEFTADFQYAPWLLATLTVDELSDNYSFPLCWDNVIYGAKGLGYVYDQHQTLDQIRTKKVITYYYSFSEADLRKTRKGIYRKNQEYWKKFVFDDLKMAHPNIESVTSEISIHILGHGMISPATGFIFGASKQKAAQAIDDKIFFAHTDLAGISIFEEAFHQGITAVKKATHATAVDS